MTESQKADYQNKFDNMIIKQSFLNDVKSMVKTMNDCKGRYQAVSLVTKTDWEIIAVFHAMECSLKFDKHLHNGDSLKEKTVLAPAGRPITGNPPFTWEESAIDAINFDNMDGLSLSNLPYALYRIECYNGLGYYKKGLNTPYLWSGTQFYTTGKFIEVFNKTTHKYDVKYDVNLVSKQVGAAVLLKELISNI